MQLGLVSVSFRKLSVAEIIDLALANDLAGIEWGGDVHVPHGDVALARDVRKQCEDASLVLPSYGSYYRTGVSPAQGLPFETVLDSALALGAPVVRVWAGGKERQDSAAADIDEVIADSLRIAEMAVERGVRIAFEYHGGTLTSTDESAKALFQAAPHPNLFSYWQPNNRAGCGADGLRYLVDNELLSHIHFNYINRNGTATDGPTSGSVSRWAEYLGIAGNGQPDRFLLLELFGTEPSTVPLYAAAAREALTGLINQPALPKRPR